MTHESLERNLPQGGLTSENESDRVRRSELLVEMEILSVRVTWSDSEIVNSPTSSM